MTQPLTFGVEFEFALAYLENDTPLPYSEDVKKILHFHPTLDDWPQNVGTLSKEDLLKIARKYAARRHLRNTIREAGFPMLSNEKACEVEADVDKWEVVDDGTVKGPNGSPYSWLSMEIRSPAMYFTSGSLKAVADVLALMSNTYGIHINSTMGLHVHCGDSDRSFDLSTLSNLVSFFWGFEPQLNSPHPAARQDQPWGISMRESSKYAMQYEAKYGRRPRPLTGVIHFLNGESIGEVVKQASRNTTGNVYKFCQYNFTGIFNRAKGIKKSKATIEFRQHEGSMSAIAVVQWIKTVVGIVDYIQQVDNGSLTELLRIVEHETWEKLGDGEDDEREREHGPILAESHFTIVHLLRHMLLWGPATYYSTRWRKLAKKPRSSIAPTSLIEWQYEKTAIPGSDEYKRLDRLREIWEENRTVSAAQPLQGWKFDPNHPAWPQHRYLSNDWDAATNPSEPSTDRSSDDSSHEEVSVPIPSQPSIPATFQVPHSDLNTLDDLPNTAEELDAYEAALDKELEEHQAPYSADNTEANDKVWRQRVRDGNEMKKGDGEIPKGSANPFDDARSTISGTISPAVSPKTNLPLAEEE